MKWIDIKEEKPGCCKAVLVLCPSYDLSGSSRLLSDKNGYLFLIPRLGHYICGSLRFELYGTEQKTEAPREIRYWMPIPEDVEYKEDDE